MDWFKGKSTGNHGFYHQIYGFPVNFPIIQFYEISHWNSSQLQTASLHHFQPRRSRKLASSSWRCQSISMVPRSSTARLKNPDGDGLKTHKTAEKLVKQCEIYWNIILREGMNIIEHPVTSHFDVDHGTMKWTHSQMEIIKSLWSPSFPSAGMPRRVHQASV